MERMKHRSGILVFACALLGLAPGLNVQGAGWPVVVYARNAAPSHAVPGEDKVGAAIAAGPALPAVNTLLARVLERAGSEEKNDRGFQSHYAYKRSKLTEERNAQGRVEKRHQSDSPHVPTPAQTAAESKPLPGVAKMDPQSNRNSTKRPMDRKDFPLNQELLDHFRFTIVRRDVVHDRPALVLDFSPVQHSLPAMSLKDYFLNKVAGRVWIDEEECALVQADVRLTQSASVAAGLIGTVKGLWYHLERERTLDGYWFTAAVKWHVELREFLVQKILDYVEETREVKRVR